MSPRLFAKRRELPCAGYQAILFSGRPDRAGLADVAGERVGRFRATGNLNL